MNDAENIRIKSALDADKKKLENDKKAFQAEKDAAASDKPAWQKKVDADKILATYTPVTRFTPNYNKLVK